VSYMHKDFCGLFQRLGSCPDSRHSPKILELKVTEEQLLWTVRFSKVPRVIHCRYCFASMRSKHLGASTLIRGSISRNPVLGSGWTFARSIYGKQTSILWRPVPPHRPGGNSHDVAGLRFDR